MTRLGLPVVLVSVGASILSAQGPAPRPVRAPAEEAPRIVAPQPAHPSVTKQVTRTFRAPETFQKYCFECHGGRQDRRRTSASSGSCSSPSAVLGRRQLGRLGTRSPRWSRPGDAAEGKATLFPTDAERARRRPGSGRRCKATRAEHAGDPGRVTVRRLTSAEYAYAIRDLTGIDIKVGIDASSDSVGGEGFANFGDVQFVQDASIERYLEAAKLVADHAVIGAGPLRVLRRHRQDRARALRAEPDRRSLRRERASASSRAKAGARSGSSATARRSTSRGTTSTAWRSATRRRRCAGSPAKEGITGRFAEHIWAVVNKPNTGYPTRTTVDGWQQLPAPTSDITGVDRQGARRVRRDLQER